MTRIGLYARVSTDEQDVDRQIADAREYAEANYTDPEIELYPDVVSGAAQSRGEEYERLWADIAEGKLDVVVVHELSRLSRLGAGATHEFLEHALENDTSVRDLEVGLELNLDDGVVDRAVKQLIAGVMGDLARVEHKQKLRRINSGIRAAQDAGKWTGRPPRGFTIGEDKRLHVDVEEFLLTREALARVERGESKSTVADKTGIPLSTLSRLYEDRSELYLAGDAAEYDDRVDQAVDELRPLDDLSSTEVEDLESRMRDIAREEVQEASNDS
ncbi:recombinase family protein [Natronoarchaeum rubrum]|uniref:recombinase family protein n=1 Tax=Natronoarchaeum rubrum TaxID=755311 RepID=UPI00211323A8|nr:recombinase family protein [Natronoarchaeum rubrum]